MAPTANPAIAASAPPFRNFRRLGFFDSIGSSLAAFSCRCRGIPEFEFFDEMYARPVEQIKLSFAKAAGNIVGDSEAHARAKPNASQAGDPWCSITFSDLAQQERKYETIKSRISARRSYPGRDALDAAGDWPRTGIPRFEPTPRPPHDRAARLVAEG